MASFSIVGYGVYRCPGFCAYCSAASTASYQMGSKQDVKYLEDMDKSIFENEYKADWNAVKKLLENDPQVVSDKNKEHIHFDCWGADSSTNILMIEDMRSHLVDISKELGYKSISFSTSTGGIGLYRDEVADYHAKHGIQLQLSHDGIGQWIRTRDIDVLQYKNTKDLIKSGLLKSINCTLNFYNNDMLANLAFWTSYLKTIFPDIYSKEATATETDTKIYQGLFIKLNHIYNGTPATPAKNMFGLYNGKVYTQLIDQPIGDMNFTNDIERAEKYGISSMAHNLDDYIHSWRVILTQLGTVEAIPFYSYIVGQLQRFKIVKDGGKTGACRSFQRYRHNIGNPQEWSKTTFAFDTLGRYTECNLLDSSFCTKNPGGEQPTYCSACRYRDSSECKPCGSECFPDRCKYNYVWNNFLEECRLGIYKIPNRYDQEILNGKSRVSNNRG